MDHLQEWAKMGTSATSFTGPPKPIQPATGNGGRSTWTMRTRLVERRGGTRRARRGQFSWKESSEVSRRSLCSTPITGSKESRRRRTGSCTNITSATTIRRRVGSWWSLRYSTKQNPGNVGATTAPVVANVQAGSNISKNQAMVECFESPFTSFSSGNRE